jgi:hypothetical protein
MVVVVMLLLLLLLMMMMMISVQCTSSKTSNLWLSHCHICSVGKTLHTIEKLMNIICK